MRSNNQVKRYQNQRGGGGGRFNNNRPFNQNGRSPNRNSSFESHGPNVRIRGTAQQLAEKYQQYARDVATNGDHVLRENFLQHSEHYFRMFEPLENNQPNVQPQTGNEQPSPASTGKIAPRVRRRRWELPAGDNSEKDQRGARDHRGEDRGESVEEKNAFNDDLPAFLEVDEDY